jgi:hypothetical protein
LLGFSATPILSRTALEHAVTRICLQIRLQWRWLALPTRIATWSLTSLQQRVVKSGGRLIKHARYYWLLLTEGI